MNDRFMQKIHPALIDMAEGLIADSNFDSQAELVAWLEEQVTSARRVVEHYNILVTGSAGSSAEMNRRLAAAWDNLNFFVDELRAHREIMEAQRSP